jgi:Sensors of blue-light using FAD
MVMQLMELTYLSTLTDSQGADLPSIVHSARRNNQQNGITGMLLCLDGCIMQTIEGEKDVVQKVFSYIRTDTRHIQVLELLCEPIKSRKFIGWSVGYRGIESDAIRDLSKMGSVFKFSKDEVLSRMHPGSAMTLLSSFGG